MNRQSKSCACVATWMLLAAAPLHAQVTVLRNLNFGTILTGTTTSVLPTSAGAANWRISGTLGLSGSITLTLPTVLTRVGGGTTMPVSFCSTCGIYRVNNSNPNGGTVFNPNTGVSATFALFSDVYVWVGGAVNPPLPQASGSYTGTIVLTTSALL